jgi:signal transduction histidine kinase
VFDIGHTGTDCETGFGLLTICEIIEAHDWEITVTDSESGRARFDITGVDDTT